MISQLGQSLIFAATEAEANIDVVPNWVKILIAASVFAIPYGLGVLIAKQLKMKEYAFRITVVLFAATLGLMPFLYQGIVGALEQGHYQTQLAEYEARRSEFAITAEDLNTIQQSHPRLIINRPGESAPAPKISSDGE